MKLFKIKTDLFLFVGALLVRIQRAFPHVKSEYVAHRNFLIAVVFVVAGAEIVKNG